MNLSKGERDKKFCAGCGLPDTGIHYTGCGHITEDSFRVVSRDEVREIIREELRTMFEMYGAPRQ